MLQGVKTMTDTNNIDSMNRKLKVLEQRLSGKSFREIGKAFKISHSTAKRDYETVISQYYENNEVEITRQRNKAQLLLDKIIETNSTLAFGVVKMKLDLIGRPVQFHPEEHNKEYLWKDKETGKVIDNHDYMDSHFNEETEEWICVGVTCIEVVRTLTPKEMKAVESKWIEDNSYTTNPNRDSQKVIIDCVKLMINIWGFNNGNGTPTVFDQRKQTIRIEDSSETN
jgi:predicted MPP superfamily phosphohydrolase